VQQWGHGKSRGLKFFLQKMKQHSSIRNLIFVHHRIESAFKGVEFVIYMMSYIVLRGRWCNIIVLNVHTKKEGGYD